MMSVEIVQGTYTVRPDHLFCKLAVVIQHISRISDDDGYLCKTGDQTANPARKSKINQKYFEHEILFKIKCLLAYDMETSHIYFFNQFLNYIFGLIQIPNEKRNIGIYKVSYLLQN